MPTYIITSEQFKEPKYIEADDTNGARLKMAALFDQYPTLRSLKLYLRNAPGQKATFLGTIERDFVTVYGAPKMSLVWKQDSKLYAVSPASGQIMFLRRTFRSRGTGCIRSLASVLTMRREHICSHIFWKHFFR